MGEQGSATDPPWKVDGEMKTGRDGVRDARRAAPMLRNQGFLRRMSPVLKVSARLDRRIAPEVLLLC